MARRKRREKISFPLILGMTLCLSVLFEIIVHNLLTFIVLTIVVGAGIAAAIIFPARRNRRILFETANSLIEQHAHALARVRAQTVRPDPYGKPLLDKWHSEIDYFIDQHIRPALTVTQQGLLEQRQGEIVHMIEIRVQCQTDQSPIFTAFSDAMTPIEFEAFCAEQLRHSGWNAHLTSQSRDQGVDVIAEKDGLRVVIQCKLYSGSVGNKATQEAVAAKAYAQATHCAVVTNSRYTAPAAQLAQSNGVLLLHYSDLPHLESLLRGKPVDSPTSGDTSAPPQISKPAPEPSFDTNIQEQAPKLSASNFPILRNRFVLAGVAIIGVALVATVLAMVGVTRQPAVIIDNQLAPASLSSTQRIPPRFTTYTNERFGFRIAYPSSFNTKTASENGDGITLVSPDGAATLVVAGGNSDGLTTRDYYDRSVGSASGELGYHRLESSWFVTTWRDGDQIGYRKMFVGSGSQNSFTFTFPESQRSIYEPVVTRIEKAFKPGALDEAR